MKKTILSILILLLPLMAAAQTLKFGFLSYDAAFKSMPGYSIAMKNISDLKTKYEAETKRATDEFNKKYEDFLDGQKDFPPTILQKRQAELQELMDKNIAFKEESKRLLAQAENDAYAPLQDQLNTILQAIGKERGYAFIINTDNNSCPYIDTTLGEDISTVVKDRLK
ncbi:MAG TPA: OmpH family outer membrane protein [Xylanibacter oryzae]|nr:OmpH family outer membrane protein [Xylanibacter oryzae]